MKRLAAAFLLVLVVASWAYAAIDTEDKRRNVMSTHRTRRAQPIPDADIGDGDRAHMSFAYRGFLDSGGVSSTGGTSSGVTGAFRRHRRK